MTGDRVEPVPPRGGWRFLPRCRASGAPAARGVALRPRGQHSMPSPPLSVSGKRQRTAALHDASRLPARGIHAPAFGLRQLSGAFDKQKQPHQG